MAGEMTRSEVTRDAWPLHFAIADAVHGTVEPFDQYQGPYVAVGRDVRGGTGVYATAPRIPGVVRLWVITDDGVTARVYNEDNEKQSDEFLMWQEDSPRAAAEAAMRVLKPRRRSVLR